MRVLPNKIIGVDFWGPLQLDREELLYLTIIDYCTRWAEIFPVRGTGSEEVVSALFNGWISRFGMPSIVVTDNDTQFEGALAEVGGVEDASTSLYPI